MEELGLAVENTVVRLAFGEAAFELGPAEIVAQVHPGFEPGKLAEVRYVEGRAEDSYFSCGHSETRGQLVRCVRRRGLPRVDDLGCAGTRPGQREARGGRGGYGVEHQRGDHPELTAARSSERPEQVRLPLRIASHHPTIGENDRRGDQTVTRQSVPPAEQPEPTAESQPGDPDSRPAARR